MLEKFRRSSLPRLPSSLADLDDSDDEADLGSKTKDVPGRADNAYSSDDSDSDSDSAGPADASNGPSSGSKRPPREKKTMHSVFSFRNMQFDAAPFDSLMLPQLAEDAGRESEVHIHANKPSRGNASVDVRAADAGSNDVKVKSRPSDVIQAEATADAAGARTGSDTARVRNRRQSAPLAARGDWFSQLAFGVGAQLVASPAGRSDNGSVSSGVTSAGATPRLGMGGREERDGPRHPFRGVVASVAGVTRDAGLTSVAGESVSSPGSRASSVHSGVSSVARPMVLPSPLRHAMARH